MFASGLLVAGSAPAAELAETPRPRRGAAEAGYNLVKAPATFPWATLQGLIVSRGNHRLKPPSGSAA